VQCLVKAVKVKVDLKVAKKDARKVSIHNEVQLKNKRLKDYPPGPTLRDRYASLIKELPYDEVKDTLPSSDTRVLGDVLRTAARMYGLPVPMESWILPLGYDSYVTIDGKRWSYPNDEAFKILVRAKYLLRTASIARVTVWVENELKKIGYNFMGIRAYNPKRGIAPSSLFRVMKYYRPLDECVLPLHERQIIFRAEIESTLLPGGSTVRRRNRQ
jgi:hypothetical protein